MKARGLLISALLACAGGAPASAALLETRPAELTLSHSDLPFADAAGAKERLGLSSVSLDLKFGRGLSAGLSAVAATFGRRGGFIGLGVDLGLDLPLPEAFSLKPRVLAGAAGGVGTPVGGGLMLRPSLALSRDFGPLAVGAGWAWTDFPDGGLSGGGPFAQISLPTAFTYAAGEGSTAGAPAAAWESRTWRLTPTAKTYLLSSSQTGLDGLPYSRLALAGIAVEHELGGGFFSSVEAFGAVAGGQGAYMSLTGGAGYALALGGPLTLSPKLNLGAAGGRSVDSGGGLIAEPRLGLSCALGAGLALELDGGYLYSRNGNLRAPTASAGLSLGFEALQSPGRPQAAVAAAAPEGAGASDWRLGLSSQRYALSAPQDLAAFELDFFALPWLFLSGSAAFPYRGTAAGYAAGLFGAGLRLGLGGPLALELQGKAGAAGGGALPTGSGKLLSATAGLDLKVRERVSLYGIVGGLKFVDGDSAKLAELGLRCAFSLPLAR